MWNLLALVCLVIACGLAVSRKASTAVRWVQLGLIGAAVIFGWMGKRIVEKAAAEDRARIDYLADESVSLCDDVAGTLDVLDGRFEKVSTQQELRDFLHDDLAGTTRWIESSLGFCRTWRHYAHRSSPSRDVGRCASELDDAASELAIAEDKDPQHVITGANRARLTGLLASIAKALREGTPCEGSVAAVVGAAPAE